MGFLVTCDSQYYWDPSYLRVSSQVSSHKLQVESQVQKVNSASQVSSRKIADSSRLESQALALPVAYVSVITLKIEMTWNDFPSGLIWLKI